MKLSKEITLSIADSSPNAQAKMFDQISVFVRDNWSSIFTAAGIYGCAIEEDYYAPERIQINKTRLHRNGGLKYANGHKYSQAHTVSDEDLEQACNDIQELCTIFNEGRTSSLSIITVPA